MRPSSSHRAFGPGRCGYVRPRSEEVTYETDVNLHNIHCIDLQTDGEDWWWPRTITIQVNNNDPIYFYNTYNQKLSNNDKGKHEPTESSKQPIRTRYLGHVNSYQPIRDQYFLIFLGQIEKFVFPNMRDIGTIRCVALRALVGKDAWLFNTMTITCGKKSKTFNNSDQIWLEVDEDSTLEKSESFLKLCD
eukprot:sb/3471155/